MTYEEALEKALVAGVGKARGLAHLAVTIQTLSLVHAINPKLVYDGARRRRLTASQVRKLDAETLGDLMFVR